jgi:DNA primase
VTLIPDDLIEQVRDAADLVGLIGEHVELKRTGSDFRGPCPFHGGTHRNLAVIPKKGMFYCFVCHEGGDVFTFLMKRLGMDYPTAVREVARRVGITIPERGTTGPDPREPLYSAVAAAGAWFARQLRDNPEAEPARAHLRSRTLDLDTVLPLGLGYAPRGTAFQEAMHTLGINEPVLLETGLLVRRDDGSVYPRFRGRLLFPIHDLRARIVGFGGRVIGEGEPKYLNSPDSPIFHKGTLLYNLHTAKLAIRKAERALLVEGYFDVLRLALAGVEEVVAPMGTGLTGEQAELLGRYTNHVVLLYDSDDAGLRATFRAGDELLRRRIRVSVATLPQGEDPDTIVQRQGPQALAQVLKDAIDLFERKIQILEGKGFFGTLPGRRRALDRLLPTIRATADPISRELYLSRAAEVAGVRKDVLEREAGTGSPSAPAVAGARPTALVPAGAERSLLLLMLAGDPWRARVREAVDADEFEYPVYRAVFDALVDDAPDRLDEMSAQALEALREEGLRGREADDVFTGAVNWIQARALERQVDAIDRELPVAPEDRKMALVLEKKRLSAEMNARYPKFKATRRRGASGT